MHDEKCQCLFLQVSTEVYIGLLRRYANVCAALPVMPSLLCTVPSDFTSWSSLWLGWTQQARWREQAELQLDIPDFSNSVLSHLNQLRMQGRLWPDIVVNVQGQSFRAHKVVLAASSPYFRDHMSLSEMSTVSISVIRNPTVFEQLLSFCYTGRLCLQLADIISYLTAASFLQMQHIIDRCTQILEGIHFKISVADVAEDLGGSGQTHRGGGADPGVRERGAGAHALSAPGTVAPWGLGVRGSG